MSTLTFTKMHGAGNDFVVLNNLAGDIKLDSALIKRLADRHFGVGADQVLIVEQSTLPNVDFKYRIFNADGQEVQQCGNGARCFAQYVFDQGLSNKRTIRVETLGGLISPEIISPNSVRVDMGPARFIPTALPFVAEGLSQRKLGGLIQYKLPIDLPADLVQALPGGNDLWISIASMGNPHAVIFLEQTASDSMVANLGAMLECHPRFPERVNVGFLHVLDRNKAHLRVFERGVGETLACGTGACAAAVCGMQAGLLSDSVDVVKAGGTLHIQWEGGQDDHVFMTGPAQTVFQGEFLV